jgi:hypothetical protein
MVAVDLDLLINDVMNELALDDKLGCEIPEPPDFFRGNNGIGFYVLGDILEIVLPLASAPDPVFRERPSVDLEEKWIQLWHTL